MTSLADIILDALIASLLAGVSLDASIASLLAGVSFDASIDSLLAGVNMDASITSFLDGAAVLDSLLHPTSAKPINIANVFLFIFATSCNIYLQYITLGSSLNSDIYLVFISDKVSNNILLQ
ncbi:hypothetical protein [Vibrio neonatus]|uniref:hypothetical protein n=1 Tax=Vibrio neonatus TaxID=278860 RepID=UPI0021C2F904|nr:hypothetical protein [Vibrio neonatus]